MKTEIFTAYRLILLLTLFSLTSTPVFAQTKVMDVVEVDFDGTLNYSDPAQGDYVDPYMDVDVWIRLYCDSNCEKAAPDFFVPVFWDGGNTFRARLVASYTGNWKWEIINTTVPEGDTGFLNETGSFSADSRSGAEKISNPNNRGFIRVADNNRTLEYADGEPFFYTADTSWSALTAVYEFDDQNGDNFHITGITFKDYIAVRRNQGFNGLNVIASFPDDTYLDLPGRNRDLQAQTPPRDGGLWSDSTDRKKVGPNGETPFKMKVALEPFTHWSDEVNYKKINPDYWQSVDIKMQELADQGFVTLFETVRRHERWPFRNGQDEKDAFYNYVRYLWARYGCYNMIFSWVHHDTNAFAVFPDWVPLVQHAHDSLSSRLGNRMPYGQPRTAMSFKTSLEDWNLHIPDALDIQNVSNKHRDERMHQWLNDLYDNVAQPALNLEPFYPGWGLHSGNEINPGLDDATMAQMQMYGSVLSGGLAGHAWGDTWYAGAAHATSGRIVPENDPQVHALGEFLSGATGQLENFESQAMRHLKDFILDSGHEYHRLIPAADTHLSFSSADPNENDYQDNNGEYSKRFVHTLSISDDQEFALGFFTADNRGNNANPLPILKNLRADTNYLFEWWDVTNGGWTSEGLQLAENGELNPSAFSNMNIDRTKNWAYRIRSEDYMNGESNSSYALGINTGGAAIIFNGDSYGADNYFDTGNTLDRPQTGLPEPYQSFRFGRDKVMGYDIPLGNGDYTVRLHFAELWFGATGGGSGGAGSRVFDVSLEGQLAEDNLDVFAEVGAEAMLVKTHTVTVTDGELNIDFDSRNVVGGERHPIINAIEILEIEGHYPADPLIGHWPLDEQNGTTANDASGQNLNGTLVNGLTFDSGNTNGQIGGALTFDGTDDRINLPDIDKGIQSGFTVSAWINPEHTSGYQGIAGTDSGGGFMTFVHNGSLAFALRTDFGREIKAYGTIIANQWQHIAVTYDGSTMTWYVDGAVKGTALHTGQVLDRSNGYIGWSGWRSEYFEGRIDDVRLYDSALTDQQIVSLFDQNSGNSAKGNLALKANLSVEDTENMQMLSTPVSTQTGYVYPNATVDRFRINGMGAGAKEIAVLDFSGRVLITLKTDREEPELDLSTYPKGIYIVEVLQSGSKQIFKVVKE